MSTVCKSFSGRKTLLSLILSLAFLVGCGTPANKKVTKDSITSPSPSPLELPKEKKLEELPVVQLEEKVKKPEPPRVYSLSVRNASIRDVLLSFAKESKVNIIVDPDVSGNVTIDLKDVTLTQAIDALLTPMGLEYKLEDGFIRVSKPKPVTRIFRLNYVATQRRGARFLSTSITSGAGGGVTTGGGAEGGTAAAGGGAGGTVGGLQAGFSRVAGEDVQDIFREIELSLAAIGLKSTGMISAEGATVGGAAVAIITSIPPGIRGIFSINRQAGIVLVTAFPDVIAKVAELLETIEGTIQKQVLIQAKIVEVTLRDEFRYGINYDMVFNFLNTGKLAFAQNLQENRALLPSLVRDIQSVQGFFQFTVKTGDVETILEALSFQGDVNVISSPKLSTLNNQTAILRVGTQRTFFKVTTTTTTTTGLPIIQESVTENTITIGVTLDVTPQISPDGFITMSIHPSVTDQVGVTVSRKGDEAPVLDVRETDTVIRVKDGETITIGGLMQERKDLQENRVPLLGKIPGLGVLFKEVDKKKKKVDLVIFLTPTILVGDRVEDLSTEELQRFKVLEKEELQRSKLTER